MIELIVIMTIIGIALFAMTLVVRDISGLLLIALMVVTPISNAEFMPRQLMGIQGLNVYNLLWLVTLGVIFGRMVISREKLESERFFTGISMLFMVGYGFCVLWGMIDIDGFPTDGRTATSRRSLFLQQLIRPTQIFLTGWVAFLYARMAKSTKIPAFAVLLSAMLWIALCIAYFGQAIALRGLNEQTLYVGRDALSGGLGIHANSVGALSVYFLIFASLIRPKEHLLSLFRLAVIYGTGLCVVLSFSRISYLAAAIVGLALYTKLSNRERAFAIVGCVLVAGFFAGPIVDRLGYRLDTGDVEQISAGRIDRIWIPLLADVVERPILGNGVFAILKSQAYNSDAWGVLTIDSPHCAYLEILLDMGFVGLLLFGALAFQIYRRAPPDHPIRLMLVALGIVAITGHSFYPYIANFLIWPVYGMMAAEMPLEQETQGVPTPRGWGRVKMAA